MEPTEYYTYTNLQYLNIKNAANVTSDGVTHENTTSDYVNREVFLRQKCTLNENKPRPGTIGRNGKVKTPLPSPRSFNNLKVGTPDIGACHAEEEGSKYTVTQDEEEEGEEEDIYDECVGYPCKLEPGQSNASSDGGVISSCSRDTNKDKFAAQNVSKMPLNQRPGFIKTPISYPLHLLPNKKLSKTSDEEEPPKGSPESVRDRIVPKTGPDKLKSVLEEGDDVIYDNCMILNTLNTIMAPETSKESNRTGVYRDKDGNNNEADILRVDKLSLPGQHLYSPTLKRRAVANALPSLSPPIVNKPNNSLPKTAISPPDPPERHRQHPIKQKPKPYHSKQLDEEKTKPAPKPTLQHKIQPPQLPRRNSPDKKSHQRDLSGDGSAGAQRGNAKNFGNEGVVDTQNLNCRVNESKKGSSRKNEMKGFMDCCRINRPDKVANHEFWFRRYLFLTEGILSFFEDEPDLKTASPLPEETIFLKGADVSMNKRSDKYTVSIHCCNGLSYTLAHEDYETTQSWFDFLKYVIRLTNEKQRYIKQTSVSKASRVRCEKGSISNFLQNKAKLIQFLTKRSTKTELQQRGIYKEPTFGGSLEAACSLDNSPGPPTFLRLCLEEIEKRGLAEDGIYRKSGSISMIQNIRVQVNQGVYKFGDVNDIHALTGVVKLYFRELPHPLIPSSFVQILGLNLSKKKEVLGGLLSSLSPVCKNTLNVLIIHLKKVVDHEPRNRMTIKNLSLIFGPTLMWKEDGGVNIGHLVNSQILIENILELHDAI